MFLMDDIDYLNLGGFTINYEDRVGLNSSLRILKDAEKYDNVSLWGRILGVQKDYFIAQCWNDDIFGRKYFYSTDTITWLQLPEITEDELKDISEIYSRFIGDPSYEYQLQSQIPQNNQQILEEDNLQEKEPINEEKRLSGVIKMINYDVEIVPRGAFYQDKLKKIHYNDKFHGLNGKEMIELSSYFHFRSGFKLTLDTIEDRIDIDQSIDIFENIEKDKPDGIWSLQIEHGGSTITLKSLLWPGYFFFHAPRTDMRQCKFG
jgi:radial spoke head protein 9